MSADRNCTGESDCPAQVHVHNCELDTDQAECNQPWEHSDREWTIDR